MGRLGKDRNPYRAGFLQFVGVADSYEEAYELYREPAEYFYGRCLHVDPRFASPAGYQTEATIRSRIQSQVALAAQGGTPARSGGLARDWDTILDEGYVVIGSPEQVAEQLTEVCTSLNVGHLMLLLQFGNMSSELARENTRRYAEDVMPLIGNLFDDEFEDHWWPNPIQDRATPRAIA